MFWGSILHNHTGTLQQKHGTKRLLKMIFLCPLPKLCHNINQNINWAKNKFLVLENSKAKSGSMDIFLKMGQYNQTDLCAELRVPSIQARRGSLADKRSQSGAVLLSCSFEENQQDYGRRLKQRKKSIPIVSDARCNTLDQRREDNRPCMYL